LIVLDLVQVTCADTQPFGKLRLRGAGVFAKAANLAADEEFFRRHVATLQNLILQIFMARIRTRSRLLDDYFLGYGS